MDEVAAFNQARWQTLADADALYTRPLLNLDAASARARVDPYGWLGEVQGKRVLCLAGGISGILVGRGVSLAVTALLNWPTPPSLPAVIAAVAVAATVGIVFGCYLAWKASRLDPIEALRYE